MASTARAQRRAIPRWASVLFAVTAFIGVGSWLADSTWQHVSPSRQDVGFQTDFRDAVYYPVVALTDGANPYDPGTYYRSYPVGQELPLYSPIHLVMHLPLAMLTLSTARAMYFGLNLSLMLLLAGVSLRLARYRVGVDTVFALGTLLLLSGPGRLDLRNGEPTLLVVLACYAALAARPTQEGRAASGIVVALAKPTFGIPLALVMLCRRRLRAVLIGVGAAISISAAALIPLAGAAGGISELVDSLREDFDATSRSFQSRIGSVLRVDGASTLARATGLRPSETIATGFGLLLLAVGAWAVWRLHRREPQGDRSEHAVTLATLVILVPVFRVGYDLLLLTWPLLLLLRRRPAGGTWPRWLRTALAFLLLVPMADPMSWSAVGSVLGRKGVASHLLGPTGIGLCLLTAFAIACLATFRPVRVHATVAS